MLDETCISAGLNPRAISQGKLALRRRQQKEGSAGRFAQYRDRPDLYAIERLGQTWWNRQIEIALSIRDNRRTVVYAGHGVGKTHGMGGIVQWHYDCWDPSITLTTGPNWSSIHDLLWGEIKAQRPTGAPGRLLDSMRLFDGPMHYIAGHNADSSSGFQGRHEARVLIVLDEAMGIPPYIWEATNAMMTSPDCRVCATGNPTETSGDYFDIRDDPDWNVIIVSCLEHPNIAAELDGKPAPYPKAVSLVWVEEMVRKHAMRTNEPTTESFQWPPHSGIWFNPNDIFRARVMGVFPKQSSSAIWSQAWIDAARVAALKWAPGTVPQIGCDVARFGDDSTTLYGRCGPVVTNREIYSKQGTMETAGRCADLAMRLAREHNVQPLDDIPPEKLIPIKVDDTGLGGGVTDRLRELGFSVRGIDFGQSALSPEDYANRGSEMWFNAAELARAGRLDLSRLESDVIKRLTKELMARQYKIQSDRTLRAESKEDLRKRLKRSPDDADAFVLAFDEPLPTWRMADMESPVARRRAQSGDLHPYDQQLERVAPEIYEKHDSTLKCGDCRHLTMRGEKTWCAQRKFYVAPPNDDACGQFELKP